MPRGPRHGHSRSVLSNSAQDPLQHKANEDLINFLEHKLDDIDRKLQKTQIDYEHLQGEYLEIQSKLSQSHEKYKKAALLLTEFLDDLLNQKPNILEQDKDMHLNIDKL